MFASEVDASGAEESLVTVYLTSARLYLRDEGSGGRALPLAALSALSGQAAGRVVLSARPQGRQLLLALHSAADAAAPLWTQLARAAAPARLTDLFAFAHARAAAPVPAAWAMCRAEAELARQGARGTWKLVPSPAADGSVCAVPAAVADAVPPASAAQRSGGRAPTLAYHHALSRAALCRAAALRTPLPARSPADEELVRALRPSGARLRVLDVRPATAPATPDASPVVRGAAAGYSDWYAALDYEALPLAPPAALATSLASLLQLPPGASLRELAQTRWLEHVSAVLSAAVHAATLLERGTSVLVQDPDGTDHALVLSVLTQVLLDPYARTLDGLAQLIEKELVHGGHRFATRCNPGGLRRGRESEQAPVVLLLLDALYQLVIQRPAAFEWAPTALAHIGEALYSGQYGTFLADSVTERDQLRLTELTLSVWSAWFGKERAALLNPAYAPGSERLQIDPRLRALRLWPALRAAFSSPSAENVAALPARVQQVDREVAGLQSKLSQLRTKQQQQPQRAEPSGDSRVAELEKERRQLKAQCRAALSRLEKLKEQRNVAKEHNADLSALQQHLNARLNSLQGAK